MLNLTGLFAIPGSVEKVEPYGNGHINQTYLVTADCAVSYTHLTLPTIVPV